MLPEYHLHEAMHAQRFCLRITLEQRIGQQVTESGIELQCIGNHAGERLVELSRTEADTLFGYLLWCKETAQGEQISSGMMLTTDLLKSKREGLGD